MLGEVGPVVDLEQKFCTRFFHMADDFLVGLETQSTTNGDGEVMGKNVGKQIIDQAN